MASKKSNIEIILTAKDIGLTSVITKGRASIKAFTDQVGGGAASVASMRSQVLQLAGAFAGMQAIGDVETMLRDADRAAYGLSASIQAANREFSVGSAAEWQLTIKEMSDQLKIYSESDIKSATASTIDMTKRLGLNADQMRQVIALSGDLAVGRTDMAGAVERVTAALRGEAEASEYLGLTLNETYVKGWYEQRGALQGAWKDLDDLQKAQIRYSVFLEQSLPLQGKAANAVNTYDGALKLIRSTITDAVTTNGDLVAAMGQVAVVLRDNAAGIGSFIGSMASGAATVVEFVVANREVLATVVKYAVLFGGAVAVIGRLIATAQGLNAAFTVLAGSGIVPWLRAVEAGSVSATAGVAGLKVGFIGLAGAAAAFLAAYKLGEWMTMGQELREIAAAQGELERSTKKVNAEFKKISQSTGETITSMEDLDRAVKDGRIHYDDLTGAWIKGAKEQQQATSQTAATMQRVTGEALKEMQTQYKAYADQVKTLQEEITSRQQSLSSELREMSRSSMSDVEAWQDRKREAGEYYAAAQLAAQQGKAALQAGDQATASLKFDEAKKLADEAKDAYKALNTEVAAGDQVIVSGREALKTAMAGMQQAGQLAIESLKQQQAAAATAMEGLVARADFAGLTAGMDAAQVTWINNWQAMQSQSEAAIAAVEERIVKMVNQERTVWINVRASDLARNEEDDTAAPAYGNGGVIRRAAGGMIPGYSPHPKADNIPIMATAREFIEPVGSVDYYEPWVFEALRRRSIPRDSLHAFLRGGLSRLPTFAEGGMVPPFTVQRFADGGSVATPAAPSKVVEVRFAGGQVQGDERSVEMLLQHLETSGLSA